MLKIVSTNSQYSQSKLSKSPTTARAATQKSSGIQISTQTKFQGLKKGLPTESNAHLQPVSTIEEVAASESSAKTKVLGFVANTVLIRPDELGLEIRELAKLNNELLSINTFSGLSAAQKRQEAIRMYQEFNSQRDKLRRLLISRLEELPLTQAKRKEFNQAKNEYFDGRITGAIRDASKFSMVAEQKILNSKHNFDPKLSKRELDG